MKFGIILHDLMNDDLFTKVYGIWCDGGSMAYAARASGCSYYSSGIGS